MAQQLSPEELASFKELLISDIIEIQTIAQLLIEKGIEIKNRKSKLFIEKLLRPSRLSWREGRQLESCPLRHNKIKGLDRLQKPIVFQAPNIISFYFN